MPPKGARVSSRAAPRHDGGRASRPGPVSISSFFDAAAAATGHGGHRTHTLLPQVDAETRGRPALTSSSHDEPSYYSDTLQEVRQRIMRELERATGRSASTLTRLTSPSRTAEAQRAAVKREPGCGHIRDTARLQEHQQRAYRIAFGEPETAATDTAAGSPPTHHHRNSNNNNTNVDEIATTTITTTMTIGSSSSTSSGSSRASRSAQPDSPERRRGAGGRRSERAAHNAVHDGTEAGAEDELCVSSVEFSLICPYSRLPMRVPVRSRDCRHVQCCDLDSWMVLLNKYRALRDPKGPCPVCEQRVAASSLEVDCWMWQVMREMPPGTHLVEFDADGAVHNADAVRERRKAELTTEVIDATQNDYENYLGEVVSDMAEDGEVTAYSAAAGARGGAGNMKRPRSPAMVQPSAQHSAASSSYEYGMPVVVKREPGTMPEHSPPRLLPVGGAEEHEDEDEAGPGVAVVHFCDEDESRPVRVLPSQVRLWEAHCARCGAALAKGEEGVVVVAACPRCGPGGHGASDEPWWTLVRRYEQAPGITMELTADGTTLLRGVDAAAPYLYRAGFHRSPFFALDEGQHHTSHDVSHTTGCPGRAGVWVSTCPLTRVELDFLEACCERVASAVSQWDSFDAAAVPPLFRIPQRRRAAMTALGDRGAHAAPPHSPGAFAAPSSSYASPLYLGYGPPPPPQQHAGVLFTPGGTALSPPSL